MSLPKEKKVKQTPENEFFVFKKPMVAEGREQTLLGVAFENPRDGTLGRYTPQGPKDEGVVASSLSALGKGLATWTGGIIATRDEPAQATAGAAQQPQQQDRQFYASACKFPRDLVDGIYPNEPTIAVGVEACLKNVKEGSIQTKILDVIAMGLKIRTDELDTTIVPVVRRYSIEDPWGKIDGLLVNPDYRARVIQLFGFQKPGKKNILYVATNLVACGGLSYDRIKEAEQELHGDGKDPSGTVPAKIGGKVHRIKNSTLKGTYKSDVVIMMSYRRIRYEHVLPTTTGGWLLSIWKGHRQNSIDEQARAFDREDGSKDVFWIDDHEAKKGDVPAWIGDESPAVSVMEQSLWEEPKAILEDVSFPDEGDATAGAEESAVERLPEGFFDTSTDEE
ncbi:hypothetical protein BDV96DRAFT_589455 [Lophiotrema nucula]|uniref:Uncharacterized protein n=1 Tax=Lophiotrema nucula TaxID=690887 RepID=A0A6A5YM32_9PLEO|nr:hypothetical protein BDV96DRAFT_589455 [Lophiotrema nucula]